MTRHRRPSRRASTLAIAALSLAVSPALAPAWGADLLPPPPAPVPVEIGSGWYLRADFTESFFLRPTDATLPDPNDPGMPPLVRRTLSHEPGYGGGVGYRVNNWLRVDATIDQRGASDYSAYSSRTNFATGYNVEAGRVGVLTGLVNVYADLGTWWGLTPYIGGGVGFAQKEFRRGYTQTTCLIDACDGSAGTGARPGVARPNRSVTSLAWSLTGGVSYALGAGFSLDASYRYIDLGRAKSGLDTYGFGSRLKDLAANEVRVGLRYAFADGFAGGHSLPTVWSSGNPYE
ncbi:MAG: outer membrane beta-barrel protein [Methylobacterium sp.]|uniref:outer membrane protein n=1 Tax=Methylobacterium sp. TaxID=409 RepID=UPI00271CF09D|nr:outer membrane beta-barrel protein [Methylobacterium sp.]MDO9426128.1 outer membrane beta-barrel protein [Methylobacterium sp.]